MTTRKNTLTGVVTYWSTVDTAAENLRSACEAIDPELAKLCPDQSTPLAALKSALEETYPGRLVRKLDRNGYVVVFEDKGSEDNQYSSGAAAWFEDEAETVLMVARMAGDDEQEIRRLFGVAMNVLPALRVGRFLARVATDYLGGTQLRDTGGIYWLPDDKAALWDRVAGAVEASPASGSPTASRVYALHHEMDENAIRAVRDAIISEMNRESDRLNKEILSGELGPKALQSRQDEARDLMEKVARYESILNVGLDKLTDTLGQVKNAAASAALLASVDETTDQAAAA